MKILAFDTATRSCSVALTADGRLVAETTALETGTHATRLMPMIDTLLKQLGMQIGAVDGFGTTIGPGSFTGLRIGISTLKGLAAATGKPVAGISALAALAHQCTLDTAMICALLDARKGEVYCQRFRRQPKGLAAVSGAFNARPARALEGISEPCALIGDGAETYRQVIKSELGAMARFAPQGESTIRAGTVALLAHRRLVRGDSDDPFAITPQYIRKSDAESG